MTLNDVFGSIYSMKLSDLIPLTSIQTEEDKKNHKDGYYFIFTESEWEKTYTMIPATRIFYAPLLTCTPMVYFNPETYVWLNLMIFPGDSKDSLNNPESIFRVIQNAEGIAKQGKWESLLFAMPSAVQMEVLYRMMTCAADENRRADIYALFKAYYPLGDFFTWMLPDDFALKFMAAKSEAQKEETRKALDSIEGDTIRVYRGAADKSAAPEKALSWSKDINIAYMFALKAGKHPKILIGDVRKESVLECFDGKEKEIAVIPGSVNIKKVENLYDEDSPEVVNSAKAVAPIFAKAKAEIQKLYADKAGREEGGHDMAHSVRVLAFALILGYLEGLSGTQLRKLAQAAAYHDVGRDDDGSDYGHGERSAKIYKKAKSFRANSSVAYLIRCHCIPDSNALDMAACEMDKKLLCVLKDADALDRLRFGPVGYGDDTLDVLQLRLEHSKKFVYAARKLQRGLL